MSYINLLTNPTRLLGCQKQLSEKIEHFCHLIFFDMENQNQSNTNYSPFQEKKQWFTL